MIEIQTSTGTRAIQFNHFPALEGWEIQHRFLSFAASSDKEFRKQYVMEVLQYVGVYREGVDEPIRLVTAALIDNHLETWQNINEAFEGVLRHNGIEPSTHANKSRFWSDAGAEMATSFLAEVTHLLGPAINAVTKD